MILDNNILLRTTYFEKTFKPSSLMSSVIIKLILINSKQTLAIEFNSESLPVSWFITDTKGGIVMSGMCCENVLNISLSILTAGTYTLRTKGERFIFEI